MTPETQALAVFWKHKRFWLIQSLAYLAWAAMALSWFWLPDSKAWGVAMAVVLIGAVIVGGVWLIAASFVFYRRAHAGEDMSLGAVFREGLRRSPPLLVWAAILVAAVWFAPRWPWVIAPMLLLPLAAQMTAEGFRGMFRMVWRARYFAQFILLAAIGAYLPYKLIGWHPGLAGFGLQTTSLAIRFLLAYLLAIASWLTMASLLTAAPVRE